MTESLKHKLAWNLPWLARYPFERAASFMRRAAFERRHVIFTIANHFEPAWSAAGPLDADAQLRRLDEWHAIARKTGESVRDADGTKFRHTNFYPAEQYDRRLLDGLAAIQADGLGETEIHLHHGVGFPDTAENLRRVLTDFRDRLADDHRLLSRLDGAGIPRWAFVHGNLALANSCGGRFCGVDEEMAILEETGCYADMTLPSAPDQSQVPVINRIYECGRPHSEAIPHRTGRPVGTDTGSPRFPLIFQGPLVFNWTRRIKGIPVPRIEDGALVANQPMDLARFARWQSANITVRGRSDWVFVKLYCHGFFDHDQQACIGERARAFFSEIIEQGERSGDFKVWFASAREAVNMVLAAIDGRGGDPGDHRDYRFRTILAEGRKM
jgi:hypothetical protein